MYEADTTPEWRTAVVEMEERSRQAFLDADIDTLKDIWADDLSVNSPISHVHTKGRVLELLQAGIIRHSSYEIEIESMSQLTSDVVVVMGGDRVVNKPGTPAVERRFTNLWRRDDDGAWRLAARQATIPKD